MRIIISTNDAQLERVLAVASGQGESLAESEKFREALDVVWPEGNLFTFLDIEAFRPYLRDQRWEAAYDATWFSDAEFRKKTIIRLNSENPNWNTVKLNEEANLLYDLRVRRREEVEFPRAVRDYVNSLFWVEPYGWLAVSANVSVDPAGPILKLKGALRMMPSDAGE